MNIEISVIVPTYNRAELIAETLQSIVSQSYKPAEVIVVDDGSTDETERVVREFGHCVRYIRVKNGGECWARNAGVDLSSAPWLAFCDSDDLWCPDRLLKNVQLLEKAPDVEYCFSNFRTVAEKKWSTATKFDSSPPGYWKLCRRKLEEDLFVVETPMFDRLLIHQPVFPSTLMMHRSFFERIGRWNASLGKTLSVDLEFHLRCVEKGRIGVVAAPVVGIRKHSGNCSGDPARMTIGEITILRYVLKHNPAAKEYARAIEEQIAKRSACAAEGAFVAGDFALMRQLLDAVPLRHRSWQLHTKSLIGRCPPAISGAMRVAAVNLRRAASGWDRPERTYAK